MLNKKPRPDESDRGHNCRGRTQDLVLTNLPDKSFDTFNFPADAYSF